ncbi:MAG: hypothetical protein J7639_30895 [Paenibacillaceae bacterium]|nr:hypothetical protein [Paenibacillaceae bacterium]
MRKTLLIGMLALLLAVCAVPLQVFAYSYGDANTDEVAETYKLIDAALAGGSPNWKAAEDAYKERRSEISSHFGEPVAATLDANFQKKDAALTVANFKAVLVMNLDRRFTYALQGISDYAATKLLLAKARATFDALAPYVGDKKATVEQAFEAALESLGNPGLFGVGKKEAQPDIFKEKVNFIYGQLVPLFPYQASGSVSAAPVQTQAPATAPSAAAVDETTAHAAMERTNKTNPWVSVVVVGAVVVVGGALWFARRKKWI